MISERMTEALKDHLDELLNSDSYPGYIYPIDTAIVTHANMSAEDLLGDLWLKIQSSLPDNIGVPYSHFVVSAKNEHLAWCSFGLLEEIDWSDPKADLGSGRK